MATMSINLCEPRASQAISEWGVHSSDPSWKMPPLWRRGASTMGASYYAGAPYNSSASALARGGPRAP